MGAIRPYPATPAIEIEMGFLVTKGHDAACQASIVLRPVRNVIEERIVGKHSGLMPLQNDFWPVLQHPFPAHIVAIQQCSITIDLILAAANTSEPRFFLEIS